MRLSSRKVGTHQDLKTSSGLKQKHPFSRGWNSSQSPTCFQPLHVFVYSHHGEETFCSQRRIAKPGRSSDATTKQTDSVTLRLNSLNCGVARTCTAGFSPRHDEQLQKNLSQRQSRTQASRHSRDSQTLLPRVSISETQLADVILAKDQKLSYCKTI